MLNDIRGELKAVWDGIMGNTLESPVTEKDTVRFSRAGAAPKVMPSILPTA